MTPEYAKEHIDAVMVVARRKCLALVADNERRFVDDVTSRGGLTTQEALRVLDEQRSEVLDSLDEGMKNIRAWIMRGCTDLN